MDCWGLIVKILRFFSLNTKICIKRTCPWVRRHTRWRWRGSKVWEVLKLTNTNLVRFLEAAGTSGTCSLHSGPGSKGTLGVNINTKYNPEISSLVGIKSLIQKRRGPIAAQRFWAEGGRLIEHAPPSRTWWRLSAKSRSPLEDTNMTSHDDVNQKKEEEHFHIWSCSHHLPETELWRSSRVRRATRRCPYVPPPERWTERCFHPEDMKTRQPSEDEDDTSNLYLTVRSLKTILKF